MQRLIQNVPVAQVNHPTADDNKHGECDAGEGALVQGPAERSGVEVGSMILSVNGVSVRGKGTVAVGEEVAKATGVVQLELAALRSNPPSSRKAWQPVPTDGENDGISAIESSSEAHDDLSGPTASAGSATGEPDDGASAAETVVLDAAPVKPSRSRKRKSAAKKRKNHNSTGPSQQARNSAPATTKQCELCRCSAKKALANVRKRGSAEAASAFPTGFREGYCCDCYDKLVEDIQKKKELQAERQRAMVANKKKAEDEKEEQDAQRKASNLPTLDEHFRAHGVEIYNTGHDDPTGGAPGEVDEDNADGAGKKISSGGRGVRALRKFPAAVTVWTEPPYVALLRHERWGMRCQSCFMTAAEAAASRKEKQQKLSACSRCGIVKYCCRGCQKADWPDHKHECAVLKRRAASTDGREDTVDADILMARIWRRRNHNDAGSEYNPRKEYARSFAYADLEEEDHLQSHEDKFAKELRAVRNFAYAPATGYLDS